MQGLNNFVEDDLTKNWRTHTVSPYWLTLFNFDDQNMTLGIASEYMVMVPVINALAVLQALFFRYFGQGLDACQLALAEAIQGRFDTTTSAPDAIATSA